MDTNGHQFPEKEATTDRADHTDETIEYPPKTPKDAKGSGVGQFLASLCVFGGPLWSTRYPFHSRNLWFQPPKETGTKVTRCFLAW